MIFAKSGRQIKDWVKPGDVFWKKSFIRNGPYEGESINCKFFVLDVYPYHIRCVNTTDEKKTEECFSVGDLVVMGLIPQWENRPDLANPLEIPEGYRAGGISMR